MYRKKISQFDYETASLLTDWLLLFTISENKNMCSDEISDKLSFEWNEISKTHKNFYLTFKSENDIERELFKYEIIGLIALANMRDDSPCWKITENGTKVLKDNLDTVKNNLGNGYTKRLVGVHG